ncbi:glycosyltransferase family 2 protein [Proteus terrae]|uniref:glycosyltransferase family 2 protein n=1 Tax=Proteus terrae TaxID=1574161 RepID=UPI001BAA67C4|nr:glycosyltransferase [Proteus terrae]QUT01924.1 glycosyltransferase [Proteus terrae subsp. cibarius]
MKNTPKISVLMSVYNDSIHLNEAIDSILNQTFKDFEFIIINDGSTDLSIEILKRYEEKDSRIKVYANTSNIGLAKFLNKGLLLCSGDYIARMDADDYSYPTRLQKQFEFMENHKNIMICGTSMEIYEYDNKFMTLPTNHNAIAAGLIFGTSFYHPTVMFRADFIKKNAIMYPEDYKYAQDYGLWVNLLKLNQENIFSNLEEALLKYRIHPEKNRKSYFSIQTSFAIKAQINALSLFNIETSESVLYNLNFSNENLNLCDIKKCNAILDKIRTKNEELRPYFYKNLEVAIVRKKVSLFMRCEKKSLFYPYMKVKARLIYLMNRKMIKALN